MTSHQLAKILLEMEDLHVVCFSNDYDANVVDIDFATRLLLKKVNYGAFHSWIEDPAGQDVIQIY